VGLGPNWCARQVELAYNDGTRITMNVKFGAVGGFRLATSLTAEIDVPHMALSANADFTSYSFGSSSAGPSPTPLGSPSARLPLPQKWEQLWLVRP
jgi:hypothetical protein